MSWLGKVLGGTFGFVMGGPLGAVLGAALGHQFDTGMKQIDTFAGSAFDPNTQNRIQMAFFTATFSVMGHLSKADGKVSKAEIDLATRVMDEMQLSGEMRKTAINLFHQGKTHGFPLNDVLYQFRKECRRRSHLIRMFMEIQIQAALADGFIDKSEESLLLHICAYLGVSRFEYERIKLQIQAQQHFHKQRYRQKSPKQQPSLSDAYAALGLKPSATDMEVKKAYRRMISQHHPDKLVAKGLPEEMMTLAKEKTQQIRKAYETIRDARKL